MPKSSILSEDRKAVRKAQESKWYNGSAGACTSWPYRVKQYLSKDLSEKIKSEVQAKCDEWIAKLESIKPSKRVVGKGLCGNWCKELDPQWICVDSHEENAIPTQILGHKIYVKILDSYRKGNGQSGIKPMEKPILEISRYFNSPHDGDWHHIGEQLNFEICWDKEKQLYYVCTYYRAIQEPVSITRKNWGRTAARKAYMAKVKDMEEGLEQLGFKIGQLSDGNGQYKRGLERQFVACEGPEIAA